MENIQHNELLDARFKDSSPTATVERIRGILSENGIEVEEYWRETCVPYCYSMAVRVTGTSFSVNGKGLTKEFARASGYGELMERLQFGTISKGHSQKTADLTANDPNLFLADPEVLYARNRSWYERIAQRANRCTGSSLSPRDILRRNTDPTGSVPTNPVWCLTTGTKEYFPNVLRGKVYTTNGCAAGNSPEETLVQAISEIVERHHMMRLIDEDMALPDIPEQTLQKYRTAYDIITYIRQQGYRLIVKDCSLGTGFPVVCVCMIDSRTGRYHTHLGAYPILEIALERSLTESFQGFDIRHVARFTDLLPRSKNTFTSITNEVTQGSWERSPRFFVGRPQFSFDPDLGFTGRDNKALLRQCVDFFRKQDLDILVRDCSSLGFHTYQVIIPGYSECFLTRLEEKTDDLRYAAHAERALRSPATADIRDMLGLLMHREEMKKFTANIDTVHGFLSQAKLSADISPAREEHLLYASLGHVYHALGRYPETVRCVDNMIRTGWGDNGYLIALKRYLCLKQQGYPPEQIRDILTFFHPAETVGRLYADLDAPLQSYTLRCDLKSCARCKLQDTCQQPYVHRLTKLLIDKRRKLDFQRFCQELSDLL